MGEWPRNPDYQKSWYQGIYPHSLDVGKNDFFDARLINIAANVSNEDVGTLANIDAINVYDYPRMFWGYSKQGGPGSWTEKYLRPVVKLKLPEPPVQGMVPFSITLYLREWHGVDGNLGHTVPDPTTYGLDDVNYHLVECLRDVYGDPEGEMWGSENASESSFRAYQGANFFFFRGSGQPDADEKANEWGWHTGDPSGYDTDWPEPSDVGNGISHMTEANLVDAGGTKWWKLELRDFAFRSGLTAGSDLLFMLIDRYEENFDIAVRPFDRLAACYVPGEGVVVPTGDYPEDCEVGGADSGTAAILMKVEWGWAEESDSPQPTEVKLEGLDNTNTFGKLTWKTPTESKNDRFLRYEIYVQNESTPSLSQILTLLDYRATSAQVNLSGNEIFFFMVKAIYERTRLISDDIIGGWGYGGRPVAGKYIEILDKNGGSNFHVGDKVYVGATGWDGFFSYPEASNRNKNVIFATTTTFIYDGAPRLHAGDMVIIVNKNGDMSKSVIRSIDSVAIGPGPGEQTITFNRQIDYGFAVGEAYLYAVFSHADKIVVSTGNESFIETDTLYTLSEILLPGDGAFKSYKSEELKTGDWVVFMSGFRPLFGRVDSVDGYQVSFTRMGDWDNDEGVPQNITLEVNTPFYIIPPFIFSQKGEWKPSVWCSMEETKMKSRIRYANSFIFGSQRPVSRIISEAKIYAGDYSGLGFVDTDIQFFCNGSVFYSNNETIEAGANKPKAYWWKNYTTNPPAQLPEPGVSLNGWTETDTYEVIKSFATKVDVSQFLLQGPGQTKVQLSSAFDPEDTDVIEISGTASYDGVYILDPAHIIDQNNIIIDVTFVGDEAPAVCYKSWLKRDVACVVWNGETYVGPYPGNLSDILSEVSTREIIVAKDAAQYGFETVIDLKASMLNRYQTEDVSGGRSSETRKSYSGVTKVQSGVSAIQEVTMSGRASTEVSVHPNPVIEAWKTSVGIPNDEPVDLVTLKYLEEERALAKFEVEGKMVLGLIRDCSRSRESGMIRQKDWRASFTIVGLA